MNKTELTSAIAANASANTLAALEVLPGAAAGLALLTVVGQCIGAGKKEEAVYYTKKIMLFTYAGFWLLKFKTHHIAYRLVSHAGMYGWCLM